MDFISSVRTMFAKADIFIAEMISKIYSLILQIADVNIINEYVTAVIERIYGVIGLFMLFKMVLVIINYIIDPDKQQSAKKLVQRIIIALMLIPTVPVIFDKLYELQSIILNENIIGNVILGNGAGDQSGELSKIGDDVSYLVFSNFLDYNVSGPLTLVFDKCPNIFLEGDTTKNEIPLSYCCKGGKVCPTLPRCAYYLYYPVLLDEDYGMPDDEGNYPDSRDKYYDCKSGKDITITRYPDWTHYCGVRDGMYIYDLINRARSERSVSTMLSSEIITAIENDPVFYDGVNGHTCDPETETYSDGDFIFEYHFILATLVGLIVTFLLIVMCVDIAIRTVKLAFLQVIAPIPIVSYIDVKDSKLFSGWLKETISTYLQLFIRLAIIFFSILLFRWLFESVASNSIMVNVFIIIGILLFSLQMPKLLCELFNLGTEHGFLNLIKNVGKFAIGSTAIGISTIGGTVANIAATPDNIRNVKSSLGNAAGSIKSFKSNLGGASGALGKLGVFGSTIKNVAGVPLSILRVPGSIVAGGVSSGARMTKKLVDGKGGYHHGDVTSSIKESSMKRQARSSGISGLSQDDIKSGIKELETRQTQLQTSYEQNRDDLAFNLSKESNSADIEKAFEQQYDNYADYVSQMTASGQASHIIAQDKYNEYEQLYSKRNEMEDELSEIEDRIKLMNQYVKEK